jgi:hypothetical protein
LIFWAAATAWIAGVATAFSALEHYAATTGATQAPGAEAIAFLKQAQRPGRPLLAMAVHPRCPCTEASLAELGDLLARSRGACDALIIHYSPEQPSPDWPVPAETRQLGGVRVRVLPDRGGRLAGAMGALTSGHVVFIDGDGGLRFHGGLTLARGHRGRAPAQDAILAALDGSRADLRPAPVFGCALLEKCEARLSQ